MAATFDPGLSTLRDKARLRLGDTGPTIDDPGRAYVLYDATYDTTLAAYPYNEALAELAEALAAHFSSIPDEVKEGDESASYKGRAKQFQDLAVKLRALVASEPAPVYDPLSRSGQMVAPDLTKYLST